MIVVDANVIIYLVRDNSLTRLARAAYAQDPDWIVPPLWEAEALNGLLREAQAGYLTLEDALQAADQAVALLGSRVRPCDHRAVLRVAQAEGLTAYDACYVALARSLGVLLVTEDGQIKRRCPDVARSLSSFCRDGDRPAVVREPRADYPITKRPRRSNK